jgi:hypothetical protein
MITGIAHVNLTVPPGTLEQAAEFYGTTLGLTRAAVPVLQKDTLAWYASFPFSFLIYLPLGRFPTLKVSSQTAPNPTLYSPSPSTIHLTPLHRSSNKTKGSTSLPKASKSTFHQPPLSPTSLPPPATPASNSSLRRSCNC